MLSGESRLIVAAGVALEEPTQSEWAIWLSEEDERLLVEVVDALAADTEAPTDCGEALGKASPEPVVANDDLAKTRWKPGDELWQLLPSFEDGERLIEWLARVEHLTRLGQGQVGQGQVSEVGGALLVRTLVRTDGFPDGSFDRDDRVGAESGATPRVIALNGSPEADPSLVNRVREGQPSEPLPTDYPADQSIVLGHLGRGDRGRLWQGNTSCWWEFGSLAPGGIALSVRLCKAAEV
jgi:hypothetical protein